MNEAKQDFRFSCGCSHGGVFRYLGGFRHEGSSRERANPTCKPRCTICTKPRKNLERPNTIRAVTGRMRSGWSNQAIGEVDAGIHYADKH